MISKAHNEAYPHTVSTFFKQEDLERSLAKRKVRVDPLTKPIDQSAGQRRNNPGASLHWQ
ncbi:MAG: hypothetical protein R3F50_16550 [Gammaproteobacteria bacterium]